MLSHNKLGNLTASARILAAGEGDYSKYNTILKSIDHFHPSLTSYLCLPVIALMCCVRHRSLEVLHVPEERNPWSIYVRWSCWAFQGKSERLFPWFKWSGRMSLGNTISETGQGLDSFWRKWFKPTDYCLRQPWPQRLNRGPGLL